MKQKIIFGLVALFVFSFGTLCQADETAPPPDKGVDVFGQLAEMRGDLDRLDASVGSLNNAVKSLGEEVSAIRNDVDINKQGIMKLDSLMSGLVTTINENNKKREEMLASSTLPPARPTATASQQPKRVVSSQPPSQQVLTRQYMPPVNTCPPGGCRPQGGGRMGLFRSGGVGIFRGR
jgi:hypothetical protein